MNLHLSQNLLWNFAELLQMVKQDVGREENLND